MDHEPLHPAVARIVAEHDAAELLDVLANRLSGADLSALLLEVARRRAEAVTPSDVLAQYRRDRFVQPAAVDARRLLELELLALDVVSPPFMPIATSPLVPLGTHSAIADVHQNRVVTTMRGSEVAADPTNSLALEAAIRRQQLLSSDPRSAALVHLAAVDRVVRAQLFDGPRSFAHFCLLGLVSAGRDVGNASFETASLVEHLTALIGVSQQAGFQKLSVRLTDFGGQHEAVLDKVAATIADDDVTIVRWPERDAGRGYYPTLCCKVSVFAEGEEVEVGDGGLVDWTRALVGNNKERLMISGLSLERLATLTPGS